VGGPRVLWKACTVPLRSRTTRAGVLGAVAGIRGAGDSGQRRLHGPRQLGKQTCKAAARFKYALLWVVGLASLMGDFHASNFRSLGRRDRQGSRPVLPRIGIPSGLVGQTG